MLNIINGLWDRHTTLRLAPPWSDLTAYVPFRIEVTSSSGAPAYILTKQFFGFDEIPVGARITHWNGVPMLLHHLELADKSQGGNFSAALRLALSNMTVRPLAYLLMPNEDWVTLTYADLDGELKTASTAWRFFFAPPSALSSGSQGESGLGGQGAANATNIGLDELGLLTASFVGEGVRATQEAKTGPAEADSGLTREGNLAYGARKTDSGTCAYLRIFSFNEANPEGYVKKVAKILESLPQDRLIIDIRGNPGGTIPAGQGLIRLLKTGPLTSSTIAFRATDLTAEIAGVKQFGEWQTSLFFAASVGVSSITPLPAGYSFNVSMRRAYRTGALVGLPIEDLGVSISPQNLHQLTINDLVNNNADLLEFAATKLS